MNKKLPWGDDFWLTEESAWGSYLLVNELPEEMIVEAAFENLFAGTMLLSAEEKTAEEMSDLSSYR